MELRHLRYFQAVAEELSFSKASRKLRIAQPALSRAVKELEERLGIILMLRDRRSVKLTEAGTVMLEETGVLLQRFEESVRRVQRTAAGEEGELRVGYIGAPTQCFLGRLLAEFRRRFPRVTVVLEERTPERVWEMVAKGRLSIGLTRPVIAQPAPGLHTVTLRNEPFLSVFPSSHPLAKSHGPIAWKEIAREPWIILARREGVSLHDGILAACRRARFTPHFSHTPTVISTVLSYVEAGAGIGIIPDSVARLGSDRPLVFRALTPVQTVELVMVWNPESTSPPANAFRALVAEWQKAGELFPK